MCGACLSRVFRCDARLSQCLSVPLSVLKKDILIYLCNWIWADWLAGPLNVIRFILSLSFAQSPCNRSAELFASQEWNAHIADWTRHSHTLRSSSSELQVQTRFYFQHLGVSRLGRGQCTGWRGRKEQHLPTNLSHMIFSHVHASYPIHENWR